MAGLRQHLEKVKRFTPQKIESDLLLIMKGHEPIAVEMLTDQLFEGKDALGDDLPEYSASSVNVFGKRPGPWQLFDTGDFYNSIFMDIGSFPITFESNDPKRNDIFSHLESKGGNADNLLGLQRENVKELSKVFILPKTKEYFRRILQV